MSNKPISNDKSLVSVSGTTLGESDGSKSGTEGAVKFDFGGKKPLWIPKSQLEDWPDVGKHGQVLMKEWIALEEGLI